MLRKVSAYLYSKSRTSLFISNFLIVLILGVVDYLLGFEVSFSIFYLIPIVVTAWFVGRWPSFAISLFSAAAWLLSDLTTGITYNSTFIALWSTSVWTGFFFIIAYLVSAIRERLEYEKQLSRKDSLTGAANRLAFYEQANQEIIRAQRYGQPFTLAYLDFDNFKNVNDQWGHSVGDELLKKVAQTVQGNIRELDIFARLGGDEFALLLPETDFEVAEAVIERLVDSIQNIAHIAGNHITVSVGAITITGKPRSVNEVIKMADRLMYEAKQAGKNMVKHDFWDGTMDV